MGSQNKNKPCLNINQRMTDIKINLECFRINCDIVLTGMCEELGAAVARRRNGFDCFVLNPA